MTKIYLFDVDGTLTPPRQPMTPDFANFFQSFVNTHPVYLISGSDYAKLREQVPHKILETCRGVFGCSGAEYYEAGKNIFRKEHIFSDAILAACENFVASSAYETRTGNHIERRIGMLNISSVGRNANPQERSQYERWDARTGERRAFVDEINRSPLPYEAAAGGQISIDIYPIGWNKSVAKAEILKRASQASLVFFGDRMRDGGNDKPLADALLADGNRHDAIAVDNDLDTLARLKALTA